MIRLEKLRLKMWSPFFIVVFASDPDRSHLTLSEICKETYEFLSLEDLVLRFLVCEDTPIKPLVNRLKYLKLWLNRNSHSCDDSQ